MIEHIKMMQMPYLDMRSMLLSGQVPHRTNSSQLFWNGLFQEKKTGGLKTYVLEKNPGIFFLFLSVPVEIQAKQSSTPGNLVKLCIYVTSFGNFT